MKRVIDFDVTFNTSIEPIYGFPVTGIDSVRVEFEWDEKEYVMKAAEKALDEKMGEREYLIQYWWWIE